MAKPSVGQRIPIVLPLLGPRNLSDATGDITALLANRLSLAAGAGQGLVEYSDNQEEIKSIRKNLIDGYVAQRETRQNYQEAKILNAAPVPEPIIEFANTADDDKQETAR
mgnify:CR=1 FL=1|tara:strand:+ start:1495 stop:1824 length:330 start_codon:yes stop_codon:yes gene_type:complete